MKKIRILEINFIIELLRIEPKERAVIAGTASGSEEQNAPFGNHTTLSPLLPRAVTLPRVKSHQ
jgi:hypothetical protein